MKTNQIKADERYGGPVRRGDLLGEQQVMSAAVPEGPAGIRLQRRQQIHFPPPSDASVESRERWPTQRPAHLYHPCPLRARYLAHLWAAAPRSRLVDGAAAITASELMLQLTPPLPPSLPLGNFLSFHMLKGQFLFPFAEE